MKPETIKLDWLILAKYAEVIDNKLTLVGGGWDLLEISGFPARMQLGTALAFTIPSALTYRHHKLLIELVDEDGHVLIYGDAEVGATPAEGLTPGRPVRISLALPIPVEFPKPGVYAVIVMSADRTTEYGRTSFEVKYATPAPAFPG